MLHLPPEFQSVISVFSQAFSAKSWAKAQLLLLGAICCPGSRTICNVLRSLDLADNKAFHKYHRLLSRDKWSAMRLSVILLTNIIDTFVPEGHPLVFGVDETVERRWGRKISKRGIYRDAVRSSQSHFVKCSGLRWMSLMLLTPLPWLSNSCWALPVLTALCPSRRYWEDRSFPRGHKPLMTWAGQLICWLARYTKHLKTKVYLVGDGSYATHELVGKAISNKVGLICRMRMDAGLCHFPPPAVKGKRGPKPKVGSRILGMLSRLTDRRVKWTEVTFCDWYGQGKKKMLITFGDAIWYRRKEERSPLRWVLLKDPEGKLDPVLLACTDLSTSAVDIVRFFVRRWQLEVTFAEVRRHLGVETQRQWSDKAIERTTPLLMGLMSVICLMAKPLFEQQKIALGSTAWYQKNHYTFSAILSAVRQQIWAVSKFSTSPKNSEIDNLTAKIRYLTALLTQAVA